MLGGSSNMLNTIGKLVDNITLPNFVVNASNACTLAQIRRDAHTFAAYIPGTRDLDVTAITQADETGEAPEHWEERLENWGD